MMLGRKPGLVAIRAHVRESQRLAGQRNKRHRRAHELAAALAIAAVELDHPRKFP